MFRCSIILSLFLLSLSGTLSATEAVAFRSYPNLAYNPSFEHEDFLNSDRTEFWFNRSYLFRDSSMVRTGNVSLRVEGPLSNDYTFQSPFALLPETEYRIRIRARTDGSIAGNGVRLLYNQTSPSSAELGGTGWSGSTGESWSTLEGTFTTAANHESGWLRIMFDLNAGERLWIDDVEVVPTSGSVPIAESPALQADAPTAGPAMITMSSNTPGGAIYYTTDGSEPTIFSVEYRAPFPVSADAVVKARVFHNGLQESPSASLVVDVNGGLLNGMPFTPIDWSADVATWWETHSLNPDSPSYWGGNLPTPEPVINVDDVRANHPDSTTAGIEEALALLPESGGTLYFPVSGSPYNVTKPSTRVENYYYIDGAIQVLRKNNIHFISDGATIRHSDYLFGFSSMEYADTVGSATGSLFSNPSKGFSIRGLTFDGMGSAHQAIFFRHCRDVVLQNCDFVNYAANPQPPASNAEHHGPVNATSMTDNFWMFDCNIQTEGLAVYIDGVHNGGFVNCSFDVGDNRDALMMFTNNDMWEWSAEQRTTQYVVMADSHFIGPGKEALQTTAANLLATGNRTSGGNFNSFLSQSGRGPSNLQRYLYYNGSGMVVMDNDVEQVTDFVVFRGDVSQHTRKQQIVARNLIQNNRIGSARLFLGAYGANLPSPIEGIDASGNQVEADLESILELQSSGEMIRDFRIEENVFRGQDLPRVIVQNQPLDEILIVRNDLFGTERNLLSNQSGSALPAGAVTFDANRINPVGPPGPTISPFGGFFWDSVTVELTAYDAGETIYYSVDGTDPTVSGTLYEGPFALTGTARVQSAARNGNGIWSDTTTADFEVMDSGTPPPSPVDPSAGWESGGITLRWSDPGGHVEGYEVRRSSDGVHYETIVQVGPTTFSYLDADAESGETYHYRVVSLRQGLESASTAPLFVPSSSIDPFDGSGWSGTDLGSPVLSGSHQTTLGSAELLAGGTDIWGSADEGYFLYRSASGDWALTARLDSLEAVNIWTKAGVMIRSGTQANAANVFLSATGSNGIIRQMRSTDGSATTTLSGSDSAPPVWLRMNKQGTVLTLSESADGISWTVVDTVSWTSSAGDIVGFVAVSHEPDISSTVLFSEIEWSDQPLAATSEAPTGVTAEAEGGTGVRVEWTAVGGMPDSFHVERATNSGSFALVGITAGSSGTFQDHSLAPETAYRYRVRSVLDGVVSQPSTEAVVTTSGITFAEWEIQRFTPAQRNAGNTGWNEDHNSDGVANGLVFALAAGEGSLDPATFLVPRAAGSNFRLLYRQRKSLADPVQVRVRARGSLGDNTGWEDLDGTLWTQTPVDEGADWTEYELAIALDQLPSLRFFRIEVVNQNL